ncbi:hypothetical protein KGA66_19765 [Actinocrinis puniceicyclus]|uniref:Uncharacterized protein n=1 Tax=Actinocrinis puniceicyclus TaxID=977794 RepID=A0A8J7WSP9_9ACTN|nr:hypothetical protein [Actinocrinis puniceicyclus]MBS2965297.1 hypothetical protein [Actinocrinis puniceicyclus]
MAWGTLVAAALGAVIGIGSTLVTDTLRSRRELDQRWSDTKRLVYVRFLSALARAHSRMVVVAFGDLPADERRHAVHHAFHADPQHADAKSVLRELGITAPNHVYRQGLKVYGLLREVRELLAQPAITLDSEDYEPVIGAFFAQLEFLQESMRDDLQPRARTARQRAQRAEADRRPRDRRVPPL